ncbi:MAG: ATP-binding protein [Ignavibacteriaceae bacterium]|nr:ATP-binding protein [Ignavibacteriaceae bacterium]
MAQKKLLDKFREYHFEFKHLTVLFIVIFAFQLIISIINKVSITNFLSSTQEWYQKDSAERLANLTTTSLELLLETINPKKALSEEESRRITQSFDIIFSQQILQHNIEELCILVNKGDSVVAIDDGKVLYAFLVREDLSAPVTKKSYEKAIALYMPIKNQVESNEQIQTILTNKRSYNIFVPFVLRGEIMGALYMKNSPDFSFITDQIISGYDETSVIYLSLILLGLLAMYFISSYTVKERDEAQKLLFVEHEENLKKQINYQKELVFTKRIYHTHHKAEKIMGFIKEDLRQLSSENIDEIKYRVAKYSNFISRVIYDMKWYDPPIQTIRNQLFQTNLNEVINFLVKNIFLRIAKKTNAFTIHLSLDEKLPKVPVNEFVVWEIIEPLIQNSIDHGGEHNLQITIATKCDHESGKSQITISDNGKGISPELLREEEDGIKYLFHENISTKNSDVPTIGYGCYIAYEISKRCGWSLEVENLPDAGCKFVISIKN